MSIVAVFTTIDSEQQAREIATELVQRKLVACVQVSNIESFYVWNGATQNDNEFRLMIKTTEEQYAAVEAAILELHTYELPAIYSVSLSNVYTPYAEWVTENSA
ncbi:MAG: divalent-cation tolerance protein CutA [Woeseiaceae bacterium]|nr:divalent-cation tolerance protein CutA [Woeseiaceae bacterium]